MARRFVRRALPFAPTVLLFAATVMLFAAPVLLAATGAAAQEASGGTRTITVYAAASLTDVLEDLVRAFDRSNSLLIQSSIGASSVLARQIEAGARADIFFSADEAWMNYLDERRLIDAASRRDIVGNRLVLIAPASSRVTLSVSPGFALERALGDGRLALADPESVPAGRYARASLEALGVWNEVAGRLAAAENVRAALAFVARGEAPLGIVYATDALAEPRVRVVDTFPETSHPPIRYPAALTNVARPGAAEFLRFLGGPEAAAIFRERGFLPLP